MPRLPIIALAMLAGAASANQTPMTLDDIARLSQVGEVILSPDGKHIAYTQYVQRNPFEHTDGPSWAELHVLKDGDEAGKRFVRGEVNVASIQWSADGNGLYFLTKRGDDEFTGLWVIPTDGGEAFAVCQPETNIGAFALHPDGKRVALLAKPPKDKDVKSQEEKGFNPVVYEENIDDTHVWMAEIAEDGECEPEPLEIDGSVSSVSFSPNGERLLLTVAPTPLIDDAYMQTRIRIANLEGGIEQEIDNLGKLGQVRFSPDGDHVAFLGVDDINDPATGRLKIADVDSGTIKNLTPNLPAHVMDYAWTDDDTLAALIHEGVESRVVAIDTDADRVRTLVDDTSIVVRSLHVADESDRLIAVADSPAHPAEIFEIERGRATRLTDSNPWLAERALPRQTTLNYKAQDGLELQGLLIYPLDYDESQTYPLIIYVHGGPEAHRSDGWLTNYASPIYAASGKGYFGFVPNYRGSTGKGVAFSKLDQHAYATPEFDDIVDGKNALVEQGLVDPKRVGITGGSYGGYATAWSATALTEHYAAGVMFVGISNQISKFGTTDIANEMFLVHARAWPWDDWQWMLERSPIYHAGKSETPLLIMHGDSDPRVHPSQSMEMYRNLKIRSKAPVRLVLYPGEGHGNQRAASRYDYSMRMMRWMDHYLMGDGGQAPDYEIDYSDRLNPEDEDSESEVAEQ